MKSKKIIALALTAALAFSAAAFSGAGAIEAHAEVTYKETLEYPERIAYVKIKWSDLDYYMTNKEIDSKGYLQYKHLKWANPALKVYPNLTYKKFIGWSTDKDADPNDSNAHILKDDEDKVWDGVDYVTYERYSPDKKNLEITLYPIYADYESDEEARETIEADEEAAATAKENDARYNHCWGRAWRHSAGNSLLDASGKRANLTASARLQTGAVDGVKQIYTTEQINQIKEAVGVDLEDNEIAFVYEVKVPDGYTLIDGMNLMVRLFLPDDYTTKGYIANVFHVPYTGPVKVSNIDTGTKDVMFFANEFSPYVLVLTPGKVEKYENPPTADASAIPVALLAAASLSATGATLMRRKRELGE